MPTLKYWDTVSGQYVALAPISGAYAQVATSAPNASAPAIAPPNGFLWVDTTTSATWAPVASPYFPTQTPPASGTNTFTDTSGEVWISRNGSAWKRARDGLRGRVWRNAAYTIPTGQTLFPFDTVARDPYGMWNPALSQFILPIAGVYLVSAQIISNATANTSWTNLFLWQSSNVVGWNGTNPGGAGYTPLIFTDRLLCVANDNIQIQTGAQTALAMVTGGIGYNYLTVDYLGTG